MSPPCAADETGEYVRRLLELLYIPSQQLLTFRPCSILRCTHQAPLPCPLHYYSSDFDSHHGKRKKTLEPYNLNNSTNKNRIVILLGFFKPYRSKPDEL